MHWSKIKAKALFIAIILSSIGSKTYSQLPDLSNYAFYSVYVDAGLTYEIQKSRQMKPRLLRIMSEPGQ